MIVKKRLRKKTFLGEFKEWGATISIQRNTEEGLDLFLEDFMGQSIEGSTCYFTGATQDNTLEGFIYFGRSLEKSEASLAQVSTWLDKRPDVTTSTISGLTDAWYGPFEDHNKLKN